MHHKLKRLITSSAVEVLETFNGFMETFYLLRSPANAAHLTKSIDQFRKGMIMRHMCQRVFVFGIFSAIMVLSAHPSNAQSNPSAESCGGLGMLDVQCCNCETGEYLGIINVQAGYNDFHDDCLESKDEARSRCAGAYGVPEHDIGMKWKYNLGATELKNWYPRNNCPCAKW